MSLNVYNSKENDLQLPLSKGPIRFAVENKDGSTSNSWRVWVENKGDKGDAYICCRDNMEEVHISLHNCGEQHVRYVCNETGKRENWNQWREPPQQMPPLPSVELLFPGQWGISLSEKKKKKTKNNKKKWSKDHIFIKSDDDKLLTVVSYYIVEKELGSRMQAPPEGVLIGDLPLKKEKNLYMVACQTHDQHLRHLVEKAFKNKDFIAMATNIPSEHRQNRLAIMLTGGGYPEGNAYIVTVPMRLIF